MPSEKNKWSQPENPPPPLFLGKKERDLVKQFNDELIERVIGQVIAYYPVDLEHTNNGQETKIEKYGVDKTTKITLHFHKRRLTEDQNLFVREGDFVAYGDAYYEIVSLKEPQELFGQADRQIEISADCIRAREGMFDV